MLMPNTVKHRAQSWRNWSMWDKSVLKELRVEEKNENCQLIIGLYNGRPYTKGMYQVLNDEVPTYYL